MTNVSVVNGNMTARFTLHMNSGRQVTASIAAGAITDQYCNTNAAFTGNYTVEGCPPPDHYVISQIGGSIVPGTTDIGNHADDQVTTIALPFCYTLFVRSSRRSICRPTAMLSSRRPMPPSPTNACRGVPTTTPSSHTGTTELTTSPGGIFTSILVPRLSVSSTSNGVPLFLRRW